MTKVLDSGLVVSEFELHSCYYVHFLIDTFEKGMNALTLFPNFDIR